MLYEDVKCADDVDYNCRIVVAPPRARAVFSNECIDKVRKGKKRKNRIWEQCRMLSAWL